jgi:rhodanese-related sulfurtransferase
MTSGNKPAMARHPSPCTWSAVVRQLALILLTAGALGLLVNHLRPDRLPLVADWSPKAQLTLDSGVNLMISMEEAETYFLNQTALFLDARPVEAYRLGHIQGARSLPWEEFDARLGEVMADIPKEALIITYCDGEACGLSRELAVALLGRGYGKVRVLANGWTLWQDNKLPTATGSESGA